MKKLFLMLFMSLFVLPLSGCVYSKVTMPYDIDVEQTELGEKVGRASIKSILWSVAWGDGGVSAAAKNGDIKVVKHLDVERYVILFGLYTKVTTIAYGD